MKRMTTALMIAAVLAGPMLALSSTASAQVSVGLSIRVGPPPLPVYAQPIIPGPGYIWAPGYWAYGAYGYYWVPGTWVLAPAVGLLWTPGWWGWGGGFYAWHPGYWGARVGFYGGISYGYGYWGTGYVGGYWRGGAFYYNRAVNNVSVTNIHNTYNQTVVNNTTVSHVSYNGGVGGTTIRPTAAQEAMASEQHVPPTAAQVQQEHIASTKRNLLASVNHGRPAIAATGRPGAFNGSEVVRASRAGAPYQPDANHPAPDRATFRNENSRNANPYGMRDEENMPHYSHKASPYSNPPPHRKDRPGRPPR